MPRLVLLVITLVVSLGCVLAFYADPYGLSTWWNTYIEHIRNEQNRLVRPGRGLRAPSLCYAELAPSTTVRRLHALVSAHHSQIVREVRTVQASGYRGPRMGDLDSVQSRGVGTGDWRPIWVKCMGSWAGTADQLPTLRRIVEQMGDDVPLLHVSVMGPGTRLPLHCGISMGVWRYHYALRIPRGDTGMTLGGVRWRWRRRRGYTVGKRHWKPQS
jgi:hypothetical protein